MNKTLQVSLQDVMQISQEILKISGYGTSHVKAIAQMLYTCQLDDCQSHGLFRLFMCAESIRAAKINGQVEPHISTSGMAIVRADAAGGMSLLAVDAAISKLIEKNRQHGIAALSVNRCFHFSAL